MLLITHTPSSIVIIPRIPSLIVIIPDIPSSIVIMPRIPSSIVIIPHIPSSIVIIPHTPSSIVIISKKQWNGTKYSRVDLVNFKGCLPQNLLRPNLSILSQITPPFGMSVTKIFSLVYFIKSRSISFEYSLSYTHEKNISRTQYDLLHAASAINKSSKN